jgi:phytoene/squalene synthetase
MLTEQDRAASGVTRRGEERWSTAGMGRAMQPSLASTITRRASAQTYLTIRLLVDRGRVEDAMRAYAYFRWLDDALDAEDPPDAPAEEARAERVRLLEREQALLERCLAGSPPPGVEAHEAMLVELVARAGDDDAGLESYLRHMMRVMAFDVGRRGRLVSAAELDDYTRWLAVAVSDAMHHFLGHDARSPDDEARYLAVSGAHILHMLRDTYADLRAGYCNVPREVLEAASIGPDDTGSGAYRAWVADRVRLAREQLDAGRGYFARHPCRRHRLAGLAYIARFDWLPDRLERDGFVVGRDDHHTRGVGTTLRMGALTAGRMTVYRAGPPHPAPVRHAGRP